MAYEQRDNSGSLFKNERREKDTQPNANGKAMIGGVMYYVDAWTKKDKNGQAWQSLSFKPVEQTGRREPRTAHAAANRGGSTAALDDDSVPF